MLTILPMFFEHVIIVMNQCRVLVVHHETKISKNRKTYQNILREKRGLKTQTSKLKLCAVIYKC